MAIIVGVDASTESSSSARLFRIADFAVASSDDRPLQILGLDEEAEVAWCKPIARSSPNLVFPFSDLSRDDEALSRAKSVLDKPGGFRVHRFFELFDDYVIYRGGERLRSYGSLERAVEYVDWEIADGFRTKVGFFSAPESASTYLQEKYAHLPDVSEFVDKDWCEFERASFIEALYSLESSDANKREFRGVSRCRVCGEVNGSDEFFTDDFRWPEGYVHYIATHEVKPPADFIAYALGGRHTIADLEVPRIDDGQGESFRPEDRPFQRLQITDIVNHSDGMGHLTILGIDPDRKIAWCRPHSDSQSSYATFPLEELVRDDEALFAATTTRTHCNGFRIHRAHRLRERFQTYRNGQKYRRPNHAIEVNLRYIDWEIADEKREKVGFWSSEHELLRDRYAHLPHPSAFVDEAWDGGERQAVIAALESPPFPDLEVRSFRGLSTCRICSISNGYREYHTNSYRWPEGYLHYVRDHQVKPPQHFIDYLLRAENSEL